MANVKIKRPSLSEGLGGDAHRPSQSWQEPVHHHRQLPKGLHHSELPWDRLRPAETTALLPPPSAHSCSLKPSFQMSILDPPQYTCWDSQLRPSPREPLALAPVGACPGLCFLLICRLSLGHFPPPLRPSETSRFLWKLNSSHWCSICTNKPLIFSWNLPFLLCSFF